MMAMSPGAVWVRSATWLDMVPLGTKTASSLPRISAARASRAFTVGSSP